VNTETLCEITCKILKTKNKRISLEIRFYKSSDENQWIRCRLLSYFDTSYFDNVLREKEKYEYESIELVAIENKEIVGLVDLELETTPGDFCSRNDLKSGMIWHIAVHPDHRRKGIATNLLNYAIRIAKDKNTQRIEAWTRDDNWVLEWYEKMGFSKVNSYLQVFIDGPVELKGSIQSSISKLYPVTAYAHYVGNEEEEIKRKYKRVHETSQYELLI
jgi:ribosomal protein S18 acetylase RimI-like enzyme